MPWIQVKCGIAIFYAGLLAIALDYNHLNHYILPLCAGTFIVAVAYLAHRLRKLPNRRRIWHYMALEYNTFALIGLVFWAGGCFIYSLNQGSIFCGFSILLLCDFALLISSDAFQEEFEYLEGLEPEKTNDSPEKLILNARESLKTASAKETTDETIQSHSRT